MRKAFAVMVAGLALAASAFGWGSFISSFHAPSGSRYPNGVGFRNGRLYIGTNSPDRCWQTSTSGSVVRWHTSPTSATMGVAAGLVGATGIYWVVSNTPRRIYRVGFNSGSIYGSFTAPGTSPFGAAFRSIGSEYYLYYTDSGGRRLYRLNALSGSIYASYSLGFQPGDCAYGGGYLWIVDQSNRRVRKCSTTGSTYDSFSVSSYGYPSGCGFDGTYVWVGVNAPLHSVLRFEVGSGTGVEPASMGKIKSVFR